MASGPYTGQITELKLDALLNSYNGVIKNDSPYGNLALQAVNSYLFNYNPSSPRPYEADSTGSLPTLDDSIKLGFEYGSTGTSTMDYVSNGKSDVLVLYAPYGGDIKLEDMGSKGDTGDQIYDGNTNDYIKVDQGSNFVVAGTGKDTLFGGSGDDTLWGGGDSSITAGAGKHVILKGGLSKSTTDVPHDTLIGGSGKDNLTVYHGDNSLVGGSGLNTLTGGTGNDTLVGGGKSSLVAGTGNQSLVGGVASGAADTLKGGAGSDTLTTTYGNNLVIAGAGAESIYSADVGNGNGNGGDLIKLIKGGSADVSIGSGAATDTVEFGGTKGDDSITTDGNVDVLIQSSEQIKSIASGSGTTELTFKDGQTLTYSGTGHVTVHFNGF